MVGHTSAEATGQREATSRGRGAQEMLQKVNGQLNLKRGIPELEGSET